MADNKEKKKKRKQSKHVSKRARNYSIASRAVAGLSQREIAGEFNLSQKQVSNILRDDEVKEVLDGVYREYAFHAPWIAQEFIALCNDEDKKIRLDAIKEFQKIMGISPTHTVNHFLTNIYAAQGDVILAGQVGRLLGRDDRQPLAPVIDVNPQSE